MEATRRGAQDEFIAAPCAVAVHLKSWWSCLPQWPVSCNFRLLRRQVFLPALQVSVLYHDPSLESLWSSYDILVCKVKIPGSDSCSALVQPFASSLLTFITLQNSANFCSFWTALTKQTHISRKKYKAVDTPGLFDLRAKSRSQISVICSHSDIPQQALANLPKPRCADLCRGNAACGQ